MSELSNIKPGETMTEEQRQKLAKENLAESAEANRLAAEHRERDVKEGRGQTAVTAVADLLKKKLENKEFQQPQP